MYSLDTRVYTGFDDLMTQCLHSMTQANQDLARQYINSAELVIYLTNSDSPFTHKDAEELRLLRTGAEQATDHCD